MLEMIYYYYLTSVERFTVENKLDFAFLKEKVRTREKKI